MNNPVLIQQKLMAISAEIQDLNGYIEACTNEQMRAQDRYMEGIIRDAGKEIKYLQKEINKAASKINKLQTQYMKLSQKL